MTTPLPPRAASKSDLIETILRRHGPLACSDIVKWLGLMGVHATQNSVRSLMAQSFKRFTSLKPGIWQLQDPALSHLERLAVHEQSRGRAVSPVLAFLIESENKQPAAAAQPPKAREPKAPPPPPKAREPRVPAAAALPAPPLPPKPLLATVPAPKPPPRPPKACNTECPRCFKRDVVRDSIGDWSICVACGHVL